jgi:hypothetical protein
MAKLKAVCFCIVIMIALSCVGCSRSQSAKVVTSPTPTFTAAAEENNNGGKVATIAPDQTSPSANIALPISRQVPPPEIQAQVRWFDGGAGGAPPICAQVDCTLGLEENFSNIRAIQFGQPDNMLCEGDPIILCLRGLLPREPFSLTLETPEGDSITETWEANADGRAKLCPYFTPRRGTYQLHLLSGDNKFDEELETLPAHSPRIWKAELVESSRTFTMRFPGYESWQVRDIDRERITDRTVVLYYAGFAPREIVTTVLYYPVDDYSAFEYFASWETAIDGSGHASQTVSIPPGLCIPRPMLAVKSQLGASKLWWPREQSSAGIDLFASTQTRIHFPSCSDDDELPAWQGFFDNSSSSLTQIDMGELTDGEIETGILQSIEEAHNWTFYADEGVITRIRITGPQRASIFDSSDRLVYECDEHLYYEHECRASLCRCNQNTIEFSPNSSGHFTVRLDILRKHEEVTPYSISITDSPEIILDDLNNLFLSGPSEGWRIAPYGYKDSTHWTYCTDEGVSNSAKWIPALSQSGYYEVSVFVPEHQAGTTQAQYHIFHNGDEDCVTISQAIYSNEWVSLGKYWFTGDGQEYIYLDDNTGEPRSSNTTIAFDAIKFVYTP